MCGEGEKKTELYECPVCGKIESKEVKDGEEPKSCCGKIMKKK